MPLRIILVYYQDIIPIYRNSSHESAVGKKINVPDEEIEKFSEQIKEQHMGKLFANFEPYDVQATRREAKEEGIKEGRVEGLVTAVKQLGGTMETAVQQLVNLYGLNEAEAQEKAKQYW